jgi:hypothetical protein
MKIKDAQLLLIWGITTLTGWIITGIGYFIPWTISKVLAAWVALMAVPTGITAWKYYKESSNKVFDLWAVLMLLLAVNIGVDRMLVFNYFTLWMIAGAAGYYYTSSKLPPPSDKTYLYGFTANLLATPLVYLLPLKYFCFIAALVQTAPIFYDWYSVHR